MNTITNNTLVSIKKVTFTCNIDNFTVEAEIVDELGKEFYMEKYQVYNEDNQIVKGSDITGRQILREYEVYIETQEFYTENGEIYYEN